ncbi:MAG TPA: glutamate 5-kinase [Alphaproteobacteria bacterium]|jgi:glutamate 5-kinase|nr:glutamate 5-kinase [Alphaproteobacteria bacterium]
MAEAASSGPSAIPPLSQAKRLVVKIGSALIVDESGDIRQTWLDTVADDIAHLRKAGVDAIVVTSGAVAIGRRILGLARTRVLRIEEKQAAAAIGQIRLIEAYRAALSRHGIIAAQVLVTPDDTEARKRHLNARATLTALLDFGAVPVINENDTVATAELRFGDNDRLAARVAQMASADTLVLLSDIDGLYTADPRKDAAAAHIPEVAEITAAIEAMAGEARPGISTGGMVTKLAAARIATAAGCRMAIANGHTPHPLAGLLDGARATWFLASGSPLTARKRWLAAHVSVGGHVVVDDGAMRALGGGKSLLPAGIKAVVGQFERGDLIGVRSLDGREIARGLSAYTADEARALAGRHSGLSETILGYRGREELIHRDDMVLL